MPNFYVEDNTIVRNYIADATYAPYCMRCKGLNRMTLVSPFLWKHSCGAVHDERIMRAADDVDVTEGIS